MHYGPRPRKWPLLLATSLLAGSVASIGVLPRASVVRARADEITASVNNLRDGWDPNEPGLGPATLRSGSFGQLFTTPVSGQVYAQPVVAGDTVIVATENDMAYGLDAASGAVKWNVSLGTPWPASAEGCPDLTPNVGVTGTPAYDPATGTVYLVSQVIPAGRDALHPAFFMHALNAQTGAERAGWPVQIQGAPVNDPAVPFNSFTQLQRPALLLLDGSVYAAFGSHCDLTPYSGYVVGVNTTSRALTMWVDESGVTDSQGGIWQSGGGLVSDGAGRILFTSGNGISPAAGPGSSPPPELAESVVRLGVQSDGTLTAKDFFSPRNAPQLDAHNTDLGSGGPMALPFGTSALPDLLVQAGKDGRVFLLNRDNLGGHDQGPKGADNIVSVAGPFQGQYGHPAAFADTPALTPANAGAADDYVYYVGLDDNLRYLKVGLAGAAGTTPVLNDVANSSNTFGFSSGSPVVTSNGTDPGSAVVWEVAANDGSGNGGMLDAFPAVPAASCSAASPCPESPIWSAPIGIASKFAIPATDSGRVYVGTRDGHVLAFGSPATAPLGGASPLNFGSIAVGATSASTPVTVENISTGPVTVSAVTSSSAGGSDPFAVSGPFIVNNNNGSPVTLPVALSPGDSLTAQATFSPAAPGGASGAVVYATDAHNFPAVSVSVSGNGTQPGFYSTPASVSFATLAIGTSSSATLTVTNGGTTDETLTATPPGSPFTVAGLPGEGTVIHPGQSFSATVSYQPTAAQSDAGQLVLVGTDTGNVATQTTINLSGSGTADVSQLTATPSTVNFGSVPLGQQAQQVVDFSNTGNLPAAVTVTRTPTVPFGVPASIARGLPVNPGYDVEVPLTFTPASIGPAYSAYQVNWTDVTGTHSLKVSITGTGAAPASGIAVPPPGGDWILNGSAQMSGPALQLTHAMANQAGTAFYATSEPSSGLNATFKVSIGGGTGADGMTLSLLDAGHGAVPSSVGGGGAELGFGGLPGVAVTLDTAQSGPGYPSSNFIGIATGASNGLLQFAATATNVPALRTGTHVVGVSVSAGNIAVTVDGTQCLSTAVAVPRSVYLGFTGSTDSQTDAHTVSGVAITARGGPVPPPGGGWSYNGAAVASGPDTSVTQALQNEAGSVVYPTPVRTGGLQVTFNAQFTTGTGGEGMAFALLDPATAVSSVGGAGDLLGFGGMSGVAVILVTHQVAGYPTGNFIAISTSVQQSGTALGIQEWAGGIGRLRNGTHTITVQVTSSNVLFVWLDGVQVLQHAEPALKPTALLAFTGGTATLTDLHLVRNAAISATG